MNELLDSVFSSFLWQQPEPGELEPAYTNRVLYPQIKKLVSYKFAGHSVRSDGWLRPQPVMVGGQPYYPDISVNRGHSRVLAIEVKFFSGPEDRASLMTGLGQMILYGTFGYEFSGLVLVARNPGTGLSSAESEHLGITLPKSMKTKMLGNEKHD